MFGQSKICDVIRAFLSFSENLKIRVRISTLGFSEPRKKRQKSIKFLAVFREKFLAVFRGLESKNFDFLGILGTPRDTEYPWGEGANEQKTNKRMKRVCLVKSEICDVAKQI